MNFINDRELARRFSKGNVPPKERLWYLLIYLLATAAMTSSYASFTSTEPNQWDVAMDLTELVTTLIGTILLYRTNAKGDNKEFIERYMCIGFPVALQSLLLGVLLGIITLVISGPLEPYEEDPGADIYLFSAITIALLYYYFKLNQSIKIAAGEKK